MENIENLRSEINQLDADLAELFKKRMAVSKQVAEYKMQYGLPVKDTSREEQIYEKCAERINDPDIEPYYVSFQKNIIEQSCLYQERLMQGVKVSYSGVEGAYAYLAAKKLFPDASLIAYPSFEPVYQAVLDGEADFAVMPVENSYAGDVGAVMDMLFEGPLYVNRVCDLDIQHSLLGAPGAKIEDVKTVVSHGQALLQCDRFIKEHGFETKEYVNTARAARYVSELNDKSVAAIASKETAQIYGLNILQEKINTVRNNTTRFVAFSRVRVPKESLKGQNNSFILVFSVKNEAGALAMTLDILGAHGYNLKNLKSRPLKGSLWEYYFYMEVEGDINNENGRNTLRELSVLCEKLKLVGAYVDNGE